MRNPAVLPPMVRKGVAERTLTMLGIDVSSKTLSAALWPDPRQERPTWEQEVPNSLKGQKGEGVPFQSLWRKSQDRQAGRTRPGSVWAFSPSSYLPAQGRQRGPT